MDTNAVMGQTNYYLLTAVNGCATSANSTVIGVYLPKPALRLAITGACCLEPQLAQAGPAIGACILQRI